jgi:FkbM family methyltransferase
VAFGKSLGSVIHETLKSHLQVRPIGVRNAMRLYLGYVASPIAKLLLPTRFRGVGYWIPGSANLRVYVSGVLANVRPRTADFSIFALVVEPRTATWFTVNRGDIVFDIGAHIGRYTLMAAKHASKVIAVEPEPSNYSLLKANIDLNGFSNVLVLPLALSSSRATQRFYLATQGDTARSSLEQEWSTKRGRQQNQKAIEVESETLDNLVADLNLTVIDLLKIDVEGHEVSVLEGASEALNKTRKIILEVSRGNEGICRILLREAGFDLVALEESDETSNWLLFNRKLGQPTSLYEPQ